VISPLWLLHLYCGSQFECHSIYWENASSDYFFAERGPIGGQALWKRSYQIRDLDLEYSKDPYVMKLLNNNLKRILIFSKQLMDMQSAEIL